MYAVMEFMFPLWNDIFTLLLSKEMAVFEICLVKPIGSNDIYYKLCYGL